MDEKLIDLYYKLANYAQYGGGYDFSKCWGSTCFMVHLSKEEYPRTFYGYWKLFVEDEKIIAKWIGTSVILSYAKKELLLRYSKLFFGKYEEKVTFRYA